MEIFWVNKLPLNPTSLVIPGAPTLYDRIHGRNGLDRNRILSCFINIKSDIELSSETINVDDLRPVDVPVMPPQSFDEVEEAVRTEVVSNPIQQQQNTNLINKLRNMAGGK